MHEAVRKAEEMLEEHPDYFMPQQFSNPANPEAHRRDDGAGAAAAVRAHRRVRRRRRHRRDDHRRRARCCARRCRACAIYRRRAGGVAGAVARRAGLSTAIQGIGAGFVPEILDQSVYDEVITVSDEDAAECTRRLARDEGILVGISAGANCHAALQVARAARPRQDGGHRLLRHRRALPDHRRLSVARASDVDETAKLAALRGHRCASMGRVLVAFSGGVDSSFLLQRRGR